MSLPADKITSRQRRERPRLRAYVAPSIPPERARARRIGLIVAISSLLVAGMAWITAPAVSPGILASGADAGSYLLTTRYVVDSLLESGDVPAINHVWYNGFAVFHNTPLLVYIPLTALYALLRDIVAVSHWAHFIFGAAPALAAFLALRRRFGAWAAAFAAFAFGAADIVLGQTTLGGSYPRSLALALGAATFALVDRMAEDGVTPRRALPAAALLAAAIVAHPLTGAAFLACWALYFVIRSLVGGTLSAGRLLRALAIPASVVGLAAWYLVPFFAERQGWTSIPDEIFQVTSVGASESYGWLGLPLIALALLGLLLRGKDAAVRALLLTGAVAWVLAGGSYTYVYVFVPALKASYPFVFLFFTAFALSAIGAAGLDAAMKRKDGWRLAAAVVLVFALVSSALQARAFSAGAAASAAGYADRDDIAAASAVRDYAGGGRVMLMRYPFSYLLWWMLAETDKPNVEGWYYSLTPTGRHIAWAYDASDHGFPEYTVDLFARWNVRQYVTNGNWGSAEDESLLRILKGRGFSQAFEQGANRVYVSSEPSRFVQPIQATTLAIGRHAATAAMMIPDCVVGGSPVIDEYPLEFLESFDTLVLAGFTAEDRAEAERLVGEFAAGGGTVILDLNGMTVSAIEEAPSFLNVKGYTRVEDQAVEFAAHEAAVGTARLPERLEVPRQKRVETDETIEDWRYVAYLGVDRSLADEVGRDGMSLLGVEDLDGGGQAVFVGGNLFFHAFRTGDPATVSLVRALADPATWGHQRRAEVRREQAALSILERPTGTSERVSFSYTAEDPTFALVSWANTPHWKAYLDGEPIPTENIEDLIVVGLPAGAHEVELRYESLAIHPLSIGISILTLLLLVIAYARERGLRVRFQQRRPSE